MLISDWSSDVCSSDLDVEIGRTQVVILVPLRLAAVRVRVIMAVGMVVMMIAVIVMPAIAEQPCARQIDAQAQHGHRNGQIGRASCRGRVCQYGLISVVAVTLKQKTNRHSKSIN